MEIYNYFFQRRHCISGDAAIVFSTLFRKSVYNHLNEQGKQAGDCFDEIVNYNCEEGDYYFACYYDMAVLSNDFGFSRKSMYNIMGFLESEGYITRDCDEVHVLFRSVFAESSYIKIARGVNLRGWELICYSYLFHRLALYNSKTGDYDNNTIDTWVSRLQEELCYDEYRTFRRLLLRIQQKGYLKLDRKGITIVRGTEDSYSKQKKSAKDSTQLVKAKLFTSSRGRYVSTLQS